jgi:LPS sulfotransferase NodH
MNDIPNIFKSLSLDSNRLKELDELTDPRCRYIIAMTPRSGSSYLCDVMKKCKRFGLPDEFINQQFIPANMKRIPGRTPDEYLRNFIRVRKSRNGISGLKASWFQFNNFRDSMDEIEYLSGFRFIYLTRRDIAAQAISLYKATASSVFHTNITHDEKSKLKLKSLKYDFAELNKWYEHIVRQEQGWQSYFYENRIFPLCLSYEDIEQDILGTLERIATFVRVKPKNVALPEEPSVFKKISDERNIEWAHRFSLERASKINIHPHTTSKAK